MTVTDQPAEHSIIGHPSNVFRLVEDAVKRFWTEPITLDAAVAAAVDAEYSDADTDDNLRPLNELIRSIVFTRMRYPGNFEGEGHSIAAFLKVAVKQALVEFISYAWDVEPSRLPGLWQVAWFDLGFSGDGNAENLRRLEASS